MKGDGVLEIAKRYAAAGLSVIPIRADGSKAPSIGSWTEWQKRIATNDEIASLFRGRVGIAVVNGVVSGNKELIDVDDPSLVEPFENAVRELAPGSLERLTTIATPRNNHGGRQYHYRVDGEVKGSTKLALSELRPQFKPDGSPEINQRTGQQRLAPETLIETRGEGGYGLVPGCPGACHPSGLEYRHIAGPPLESLPTITEAEHEILWRVGRSFNRNIDDCEVNTGTNRRPHGNDLSPGDDFNQRATWEEILEPEGWVKSHQGGDRTHWRRPGKASGTSATTGVKSKAGTDLFCVFSSNAYPFEGPTGSRPCSSYSKFAAFAVLNHRGDYSAAAKSLSATGYGSRSNGRPIPAQPEVYDDEPPTEPWEPNGSDSGSGKSSTRAADGDRHKILPITVGKLIDDNPRLKDPVIHGLARRGETVNIISASKIGKSWLAYALAFSIIMGRRFLDTFDCEQGRVLLVDNELHGPTLAYRLGEVATALGIPRSQYENDLHVLAVRGKGLTLHSIGSHLEAIEPGTYSAVILDAWYRCLPPGVSENENHSITLLYNAIDGFADRLDCCWVNIHHSSKGSQGDKQITDVGSGAGSQSRAADAHVILRRHEEDDAVVLDAAVRSFPPIEPLPLRWRFPLWSPDDTIDPEKLKGRLNVKEQKQNAADQEGMEKIVGALKDGPATNRYIRGKTGFGKSKVDRLLDTLESKGRVKWSEIKVKGNVCRQYEAINTTTQTANNDAHSNGYIDF